MKSNLTILFILLVSMNTYSQIPIDETTGEVKYTGVISVDGVTQEDLYKESKIWIVSTLKSGDNMVELSGDEQSSIVGTGNLVIEGVKAHIWEWNNTYLNFKFIIFCKEGRVKYSVENIAFTYPAGSAIVTTNIDYLKGSTLWKEKWTIEFQENKVKLDSAIRDLIEDYKQHITSQDEDDW